MLEGKYGKLAPRFTHSLPAGRAEGILPIKRTKGLRTPPHAEQGEHWERQRDEKPRLMLYNLSNAGKGAEQAQTETNPHPLSITDCLPDTQVLSLFTPGGWYLPCLQSFPLSDQ